jgi:hypothetical protein
MNAPTTTFVPLTAGQGPKGKGEEFRVLISPNPEKAQPLGIQLQTQAGLVASHAADATGKPRVILHRDGERITSIQVHCSCGEIIDLNCSYSDPGPTVSPS